MGQEQRSARHSAMFAPGQRLMAAVGRISRRPARANPTPPNLHGAIARQHDRAATRRAAVLSAAAMIAMLSFEIGMIPLAAAALAGGLLAQAGSP